ncbi:MAG: phage tail protein [Oscillospiraceae bacterium]|nr:phage tail protein [Oscillospiraceae bacterium]
MYEIRIRNGDQVEKLHELDTNSVRRVTACTFTEEVNAIPSATFTVSPQNPVYDHLHELITHIEIVNMLTGEAEFEGRILQKPKDSMDANGSVARQFTCEGLLSYLCDSRQMYMNYVNAEPGYFLLRILSRHNERFSDKKIQLGACDVTGSRSKTTAYRTTLEEIRENLTSRMGGEIRVRRNENGALVLDYLKQYGVKKDTVVELGNNLKSINHSTDATHIITRLIPLGAQIGEDTAERLTLKGYFADEPERYWIDDETAIAKYGIIEGTVEFDDVTTQEYLAQTGAEYLANNNRIRHSYRAEVLDLSVIGKAADAFRVGNTYRFVNRLIGLDEDLRIIKRTVDIFKPYSPTVEIGEKTEKITSLQTRTARLLEYELPQQKIDILTAAKAIATALIKSGLNGYVVANENEICIMDTPDKATAKRVWRFNIAGLGYSSTGYDGEYGLAMTMDGAIVADFITAGKLTGLEISNGSNFHVSQDGAVAAGSINITGGELDINGMFHVAPDGAMTARNANITGGEISISNGLRNVSIRFGNIYFKNNDGNEILRILSTGVFEFWNEYVGNWNTVTLPGLIAELDRHGEQIGQLFSRVTALETKVG